KKKDRTTIYPSLTFNLKVDFTFSVPSGRRERGKIMSCFVLGYYRPPLAPPKEGRTSLLAS
ncbi:hypothetical protein, partial [uncultured Prevotella sp.]|uniref:hypothetical protein n=1 Tax=uncultured Prevotella sp. TaxID=159272 RepID=UPI002610F367